MISPENALYTVLKTAAENAVVGSALESAEVQPTAYSIIKEPQTIRVGNCESEFAPVGEIVKEFDADITLQILAKVEDAENPEDYPPARDIARWLAIRTIEILLTNKSLDGAVCDLLIRRAFRGWARIEGGIYAVVLLPVTINPTGKYE